MIYFLHPEAFLLALPVVFLLRRGFATRPLIAVLRFIVLFLALALLAEPVIPGAVAGRDLILVVDRSNSMPEKSLSRVGEIATQAVAGARAGDRIGMVSFGRDALLEIAPTRDFAYQAPSRQVNRDGTDLAAAMETALALIPPGRQGSLLLLSDGEQTGPDPTPLARTALRAGVRVDALMLRRKGVSDLALQEINLPSEVGEKEPFQFSSWVRCDQPVTAPYRIFRDGKVIAKGRRKFHVGLNRILCRDSLVNPGIHRYEVEVDIADDRIKENNRAVALIRVAGRFRILCVTPDGRQDRLTLSLVEAGLEVQVASPEQAPLDMNALDGFRAVILENVAAMDLMTGALGNLARYVKDLGGGVIMTGGQASFGPGGYHQSALEQVLPVSMEIRQEQRKFSLAMAIALDRSGSMRAGVGGGKTKMDLANLGTAAAVGLLGPTDAVAVIAVDSTDHLIVPLTPVTDPGPIQDKVRTIQSSGGGIFTFTAIKAAARELVKATQGNRHMVIFADAADAEEPGKYKTLVPQLVASGITVSVIGLGRDTDRDAAFLKDLAALGKGRCLFTTDPTELPRVFAQETIQVAKSSFAMEPTALALQPQILALGDLGRLACPPLGGYSIAYLKPKGQAGLISKDEQRAPILAFWQCGLGRAATFLGEADGKYSGELAKWDDYGQLFSTLARWVAGNDASQEIYTQVERQGHQGVISIEVGEGMSGLLDQLSPRVIGPGGKPTKLLLHRLDDCRAEARFPLGANGNYQSVIKVGADSFLRLPPIVLPYSPEFAPATDPERGEKLLRRLVRIGRGRFDPRADQLLTGNRLSTGITPLANLCAWLALLFFLLEIATRRLQLGWKIPLPKLSNLPLPKFFFGTVKAQRAKTSSPTAQAVKKQETTPPDKAEEPESATPESTLDSILSRAKNQAKRRK